jgi:hypothetical protein
MRKRYAGAEIELRHEIQALSVDVTTLTGDIIEIDNPVSRIEERLERR